MIQYSNCMFIKTKSLIAHIIFIIEFLIVLFDKMIIKTNDELIGNITLIQYS